MILEHALLDVLPGRETAFGAAFDDARPLIARQPGGRSLRLERCLEQPSRYLLLVEWDALQDHTEGFRASRSHGALSPRRSGEGQFAEPPRSDAPMILSQERDPRCITIRRGGTLTDADHRLLALWAATCAEHVPHLFGSAQPSDPRPRQAIEQVRAWTRGEIKMSESRAAGGHAWRRGC